MFPRLPGSRLGRFVVIGLLLITISVLALPLGLRPVGGTAGSTVFLPAIFNSFSLATPYQFRPGQFGYGMIAMQQGNAKVKQAGFDWVKINLSWKIVEGTRGGPFYWSSYDDAVNTALSSGFLVLMRVDDSPQWASNSTQYNAPPVNDSDLGDFMYLVAQHFAGRVQAYEIWNEPNLNVEWGMQLPDPIKFGHMLQALYPRVKQADPNALVVSGGVSTTGNGNGSTVYGDMAYIAKLFDPDQDYNGSDGFGAYLDGVGSHPYGGPCAPDTSPWSPEADTTCIGTFFRRAEQHEQMIQVWGQTTKPVWATEFGYLLNPTIDGSSCDLGSHFDRMELSTEQLQADYLVGAYQYAQANWPWMGPMFLMNLDFDMGSWSACDPVRFFSILDPNGSPRPAYNSLSSMPKLLNH